MLTPAHFFDLATFQHNSLVDNDAWVWNMLNRLEQYLHDWFENNKPQQSGKIAATARFYGDVSVGEGTVVEDGVVVYGPAIIGKDCEIRHSAYIRGQAILGDNAILGHASELKHSIMLDHAKAPHFAYLGDSIIGNHVNLGAGTKLSNLAVSSEKDADGSRPTIKISINDEIIDTGLSKLGAIIGDQSQTGCNSVTNPGCLIGKNNLVYANTSLAKGYYVDDTVLKLRQEIEPVTRY